MPPKKKKGAKGAKIVSGILDDDKTFVEGSKLPGGKQKTRPDASKQEFNKQDEDALAFCSGPGFRDLNKYLRDPDSVKNQRQRNEYDAQAAKISNALNKMDTFDGTTYRGTSNKAKHLYNKGDVVEEKAFSSSSKDKVEAEKFAKWDGTFMEIKGKNGRSIESYTKFQGQDEVVFDRNSKFKVTDVDKSSDQYKIFLEEM
jgi:hypothetical protein